MSRRGAAAWTSLVATALASWVFACDEIHADPVTAPFSSAFAPDAALTTPRTPPLSCPSEVEENGPCPQAGGACEVGTSPDPQCNALFVCATHPSHGEYWTEERPGRCTTSCPDPAQIVDGAPCDLPDGGDDGDELHCAIAGATCACTTGRDGAHAHPRRWVCTQPAPGCPTSRPLLGRPCFGNLACDYGSCTSKRGMSMICEDDVWQTEVGTCDD